MVGLSKIKRKNSCETVLILSQQLLVFPEPLNIVKNILKEFDEDEKIWLEYQKKRYEIVEKNNKSLHQTMMFETILNSKGLTEKEIASMTKEEFYNCYYSLILVMDSFRKTLNNLGYSGEEKLDKSVLRKLSIEFNKQLIENIKK
jgi:hypothetical protein